MKYLILILLLSSCMGHPKPNGKFICDSCNGSLTFNSTTGSSGSLTIAAYQNYIGLSGGDTFRMVDVIHHSPNKTKHKQHRDSAHVFYGGEMLIAGKNSGHLFTDFGRTIGENVQVGDIMYDYSYCLGCNSSTHIGDIGGDFGTHNSYNIPIGDSINCSYGCYNVAVGMGALAGLTHGEYNIVVKEYGLSNITDTSYVFLVDYNMHYLMANPEVANYLHSVEDVFVSMPYLRTNKSYRICVANYLGFLIRKSNSTPIGY